MVKIEKEVIINQKNGLHARPASLFVRIANKYDASIKLEKDGEVVDGKSIISLLTLGADKGTIIKLIVEGEDAEDAFSELKEFLEREADD